ncbi:hypothetical protein G9464_14920 [Halostella sp. JP-L12]|uniref:LolA family protein n=1 Tax=Halostella TaxID=1843185 RepID=UPI000EF7C43F|nr:MULTISPECIES: outer membrane lipoprotein carrier protein LolA [Halostella]NHN48879.1 hypothetical protein [Halostella sp. JP-L12]
MVTRKPSAAVLLAVGMIALSGCLGTVGSSNAPADATTDAPADAIQEADDGSQEAENASQEADDDTTENDTAGNESAETTDDGEPSGEEVVERFEQRMESIDSYVAVQRTTATYDGNEINTTAQVWVRTDTGEYRQEVVAPDERAGTITVVNESVSAVYDPQTNEYTVFPDQGADPNRSASMVEYLVDDAELSYEDTVDLDGERTHRLSVVPNGSEGFGSNVTMWVDAETYFPSRLELSFGNGVNATTVVEYEDAILNWSIPNSTFVLDPPADAQRSEFTAPNVTEFDSREDLVTNVSTSVPDPELRGNYSFESATLTEDGTTNVRVVYADGADEIVVNKINGTQAMADDGESVAIGDREGVFQSVGNESMVVWTCEGNTYAVIGPEPRDRLVTVAESMVCD